MQYELWARSRETKVYEWLQSFTDENQFYFMLDQVDPDVYYEAMIVQTEWKQEPRCIMYVELKKPEVSLVKRR